MPSVVPPRVEPYVTATVRTPALPALGQDYVRRRRPSGAPRVPTGRQIDHAELDVRGKDGDPYELPVKARAHGSRPASGHACGCGGTSTAGTRGHRRGSPPPASARTPGAAGRDGCD